MNLFILDYGPGVAARMLCDQHVVKMPLETAQIVSTALQQSLGVVPGLYSPTHQNHPVVQWAGRSFANFCWAIDHGLALCAEYTFRYGKRHASEKVLQLAQDRTREISMPLIEATPFVQCVPKQYHCRSPVNAYRRYYIAEKSRFARWQRGREAPTWYLEGVRNG